MITPARRLARIRLHQARTPKSHSARTEISLSANTSKQQSNMMIPFGKEPGRHEPEGHKGRPVEYGVLKSYPGVVYSAAGSLSPSSTAAPRRAGVSGGRSRRHTGSSEGGGHA